MKILVCDQEHIIHKLLSKELANHGYETLKVDDGFKALQLVKQHKPEIVITDFFLPLVNGLEFIELILNENPNTTILVYSEVNDPYLMEQCFRLGAKDFLPKPFDPERVILRLKRLDL